MINAETPVRVMIFYKINIFAEVICQALQNLLPDYELQITIIDSTEKMLTSLADDAFDFFITDFNYLLNHKEWSTETSARLTLLCKSNAVRRVLFVPDLQYGLLKKCWR